MNSEESQKTILAHCLRFPERMPILLGDLKFEDFASPKYQAIFNAIRQHPLITGDIDKLVLSNQLKAMGWDILPDELIFLEDEFCFNGIDTDFHKKELKAFSQLRKLQAILDETKNPTSDARAIVSKIRETLEGEAWSGSREVTLAHVYDASRMITEYEAYVQNLGKINFRTGIGPIDRKIRGVAGGEVLTLIARAGSFKTASLQNMLLSYIQNSAWGAAFFSLEMPIPSNAERFHQIVSGLAGEQIERLYRDKDAGLEGIKKDLIRNLSRLFVIPAKVNLKKISQYVKLIESRFNVKIGVVGIDYLGLLDAQGPNEYEIISRLARDIKSLAKEINLPVIALAQTSRKAGTGETEITLDMGRGSGAIEEGADFVIGLFQSEKENPLFETEEPECDLIAKILKNRKGPKNSTWQLSLDPKTLRLGHDAEPWSPPKKNNRRNDL